MRAAALDFENLSFNSSSEPVGRAGVRGVLGAAAGEVLGGLAGLGRGSAAWATNALLGWVALCLRNLSLRWGLQLAEGEEGLEPGVLRLEPEVFFLESGVLVLRAFFFLLSFSSSSSSCSTDLLTPDRVGEVLASAGPGEGDPCATIPGAGLVAVGPNKADGSATGAPNRELAGPAPGATAVVGGPVKPSNSLGVGVPGEVVTGTAAGAVPGGTAYSLRTGVPGEVVSGTAAGAVTGAATGAPVPVGLGVPGVTGAGAPLAALALSLASLIILNSPGVEGSLGRGKRGAI